jgi:hypothetical protein
MCQILPISVKKSGRNLFTALSRFSRHLYSLDRTLQTIFVTNFTEIQKLFSRQYMMTDRRMFGRCLHIKRSVLLLIKRLKTNVYSSPFGRYVHKTSPVVWTNDSSYQPMKFSVASTKYFKTKIQGVPLATEPGISLIILH